MLETEQIKKLTVDELVYILREIQAEHHIYQIVVLGGVYNQKWPEWYAEKLIEKIK